MLHSVSSSSSSSSSSLPSSSSFTASKLNSTTFLLTEDDSFGEHPFIYAKLHPSAPILILTDTGCDSPSKESSIKHFTHLRDFLEHCPVACNQDQAINPSSRRRKYVIINSHCHYDHTLGIPQFLSSDGDTDTDTEIIASAAGRDFIEGDLTTNGLFKYLSLPTPSYSVTHWAQAFEKLHHPPHSNSNSPKTKRTDLHITTITTPGHTPDSLAWYDHSEMHLFTGDTLYEEGAAGKAAILWTIGGNMIEWAYSVSKMLRFVRSENTRAELALRTSSSDPNDDADSPEEWSLIPRRVKLAAGHITSAGDAEELLISALRFLRMVLRGEVDVVYEGMHLGEMYAAWKREGYGMYFSAPVRIVDDARAFFGRDGVDGLVW